MINDKEWNKVCKEAAKEHFRQAWIAWRARNKRFVEDEEHPLRVPVGMAIRLWGGTEVAQAQPSCPSCGSLTGYVFDIPTKGYGYNVPEGAHPFGHCFECGYRYGYSEFLGKQADPEKWGTLPGIGELDERLSFIPEVGEEAWFEQ